MQKRRTDPAPQSLSRSRHTKERGACGLAPGRKQTGLGRDPPHRVAVPLARSTPVDNPSREWWKKDWWPLGPRRAIEEQPGAPSHPPSPRQGATRQPGRRHRRRQPPVADLTLPRSRRHHSATNSSSAAPAGQWRRRRRRSATLLQETEERERARDRRFTPHQQLPTNFPREYAGAELGGRKDVTGARATSVPQLPFFATPPPLQSHPWLVPLFSAREFPLSPHGGGTASPPSFPPGSRDNDSARGRRRRRRGRRG